jgi:hypothetical protein
MKYQIELANKIRNGRAVGNEFVVTMRPIGRSGILERFATREEAAAWIAAQEAPLTCDECGSTRTAADFYDPSSSEPRCKECVDGFWEMMGDDPCGKDWR